MGGTKTGVATRLKAVKPELIAIHCRAHRVALVSSKSAQEVSCMKIFESHLVSLTNSPVREAGYHEIQEIMNEPVQKAVHTRWLSHDQAVSALRHTLRSLLATLEREVSEKEDAVASGLARSIKSYNFIATLYYPRAQASRVM